MGPGLVALFLRHASQLNRVPNMRWPTVREGSRLFFCGTRAAKKGWLSVDTVFLVRDQSKWMRPGVKLLARFQHLQSADTADYWDRHLRRGVPVHPVKLESQCAWRGLRLRRKSGRRLVSAA